MTQSKASAPAKIILFGEHFVVYGNPAILASIDKRVFVIACIRLDKEDRISIGSDIGMAGQYDGNGEFMVSKGGVESKATLDPLYSAIKRILLARNSRAGIEIGISSRVPPGVGLGSSAASCVATVAAVDSLFQKKLNKHKICELAIESEKLIHKTTSGADCYVSTFGGLIKYQCKSKGFKKLEIKRSFPLVVANTGIKHSTGDLVAGVRKFKERNHVLFNNLAKQASDICFQAGIALTSGNRDRVGQLMNENHTILQRVGVSHHKAEDLIEICRNSGAVGAKITGAGGGGSVIALAGTREDRTVVASRIQAAGYDSFEVEIDQKGLIV
jgi:mevalonate kinase